VLENEKKNYTTAERLEASDRLMAYGFGKPPQAIEAHFQERKHQILECSQKGNLRSFRGRTH
jgi:hypothetical protein